ncbi:hypothetical protein GWO43_23670 [candidate division KSB1 bacterium]|nr:hypothetical protein [candidate division KSB1 bacterium]NIR73270.1 hypothetical protein [candidate division KSB1 bacterium]NIS26976.1 hypothetical protein [candidate division KSB1 bacterium]NIT73815.1 hypothetical protein [candidate division KSB1 bacterium]NIU27720.1 hypothetical protein [candidate division KSB1 bacterium]
MIDSNFHFVVFAAMLFFLYAEIHYSFKGIHSRLKKKEPEIIADTPHRIDRAKPIPVLLLIKDADKYPIKLHSVRIEMSGPEQTSQFEFNFNSLAITDGMWHKILQIHPAPDVQGQCTLDVKICCSRNGKEHLIENDNYTGTSHAPLEMYVSDHELPNTENWYFGEFHCHTSYTNDQVEFGAPLDATAMLAKSMGLSFYCATDHSYDLDDHLNDFLKRDPHFPKWSSLLSEVQNFNQGNGDFVIVPGEEVSAGNSKGRNVHLLILNHSQFVPGDGDGAEKWFRTKPTLTINQILDRLGKEAVTYAAHPCDSPPFLQWLLIHRGKWSRQDVSRPELDGLQIWNGTEKGLEEGKKLWVHLLLQGRRMFISGGNDAHGNFSRFRQIGLPFFTMRENHTHLFGKVRTGVYLKNGLSLHALLDAIKHGRAVITDGPFVDLCLTNENSRKTRAGEAIFGRTLQLNAECRSSPEFGKLKQLAIYCGDLVRRQEYCFDSITQFASEFSHMEEKELKQVSKPSYIRAELISENHGQIHRCFTNPIWVNKNPKGEHLANRNLLQSKFL